MKHFIIIFGCFGLFSHYSVANTFDLLDVHTLSIKHYEDFTIAQQRLSIAQQNKKQAEANFLPVVNISKAEDRSTVDFYDSDSMTLSLNQSIFNYANIANNRQVGYQQTAQNILYKQTLQRLMLEISQLYFNVTNAQIELKSNVSNLKFVNKNLSVAQKKYKFHETTKADVAEAKSSEQEILSNIQAARNNLYNQRLLLLERIGNPDALTLHSKVGIEDLEQLNVIDDKDYWLKLAKINNKNLQISKINEKISQQGVELAKSQFYPTLNFSATRNTDKLLSSLDRNTYSLNLNVPIFAGFRDSTGLKKARLELDNTKLTRNRTQRSIKQQVYSAYNNLLFSKERIKILKTLTDNRKQEVVTTQIKLDNNNRTYKDILLSEQQYWDSVTAYEQEVNRYILSYLTLKQVVGTLSIEDIEKVNNLLSQDSEDQAL
ncbi:Type I secretion outer membrane protein, TolC precursor [uncultured Candidatus Thioglobus sp.]|nr:Type I secretion outer membrane protein, TolC precursor [uncultured Candidatus Thioglobus sp.]SMM99485.1 Type I secretion outer membrane protein, TolC precursor [uncultured Candidatus Thioglobus sp.]